MSGNFTQKVLAVVAAIPEGQVLTYQHVAQKAGTPKAARAVGNIMKSNFNTEIPCHRVIRSDGKLGHYNRGDEIKRKLLIKEGYLQT